MLAWVELGGRVWAWHDPRDPRQPPCKPCVCGALRLDVSSSLKEVRSNSSEGHETWDSSLVNDGIGVGWRYDELEEKSGRINVDEPGRTNKRVPTLVGRELLPKEHDSFTAGKSPGPVPAREGLG